VDRKCGGTGKAAKSAVPRLEIIYSPYRQIYQPILDFVNKAKEKNPNRTLAVVIPELVEPHWYEYLLHIQHGAGLKALLYLKGATGIIVINTPWYLPEKVALPMPSQNRILRSAGCYLPQVKTRAPAAANIAIVVSRP